MTQRYQDNITGRYYRAYIFPAFVFFSSKKHWSLD